MSRRQRGYRYGYANPERPSGDQRRGEQARCCWGLCVFNHKRGDCSPLFHQLQGIFTFLHPAGRNPMRPVRQIYRQSIRAWGMRMKVQWHVTLGIASTKLTETIKQTYTAIYSHEPELQRYISCQPAPKHQKIVRNAMKLKPSQLRSTSLIRPQPNHITLGCDAPIVR